jgi:hypothetical protein
MQTRNANATTNCDYLDQTVLQSIITAIKGSRSTPRAPDLSTIAGTGIKANLESEQPSNGYKSNLGHASSHWHLNQRIMSFSSEPPFRHWIIYDSTSSAVGKGHQKTIFNVMHYCNDAED